MTDKELFEKWADYEYKAKSGECVLTESQFLSALAERDKERVCGNCKEDGYCELQNVAGKDYYGYLPNFGCNQFEPKGV